MSLEHNKAVVRAFIAAINAQDWERLVHRAGGWLVARGFDVRGPLGTLRSMDCRATVIAPAACAVVLAGVLLGCSTAADHQRSLGSTAERETTLGIVQKEIHAGLTQDEVIAALGSPNIVTRDAQGHETWVYDKIATEASYSRSDVYGTILLVGGGSASGAASTTQKTLTVVIKFAPDQRVDTFSYHSSKF